MNDYNRGALPDPCLRLDYGFGDDWKSVELGDGTGYVRLSDYAELKAENDNLRELVQYILDESYGDDWFAMKAKELGFEANY